jgi:hypothetical protein
MKIESYYSIEGELFGTFKKHIGEVYTDDNDKYSFNFLKTIDGKKCICFLF